MTLQPNKEDVQANPVAAKPAAVLGIFDFSYQHYALGDLLTSQVELAIMAIEQNLEHVDVVAMVNPRLPAAAFQRHIVPDNYLTYFDNILPVFACNPMLRSLQLVRDIETLSLMLLSRRKSGDPMWPAPFTHIKMRQDYPIGYHRFNAFHARHGYLPQLCAPRHYQDWARGFHERELAARSLAVINPRQSSLTSNLAATYRDAPLESWHGFIDTVAVRRPDVLFVMVGGYREWEHSLLRRSNVFIPRAFGLSLAHELALMKIADLFMGTPSGFSAFATFTNIAYAILNMEHRFAEYGEISPGDRRYPFAHANQVLTWHRETTDELLSVFEELCTHLRPNRAAKSDNPSAGSAHADDAMARQP